MNITYLLLCIDIAYCEYILHIKSSLNWQSFSLLFIKFSSKPPILKICIFKPGKLHETLNSKQIQTLLSNVVLFELFEYPLIIFTHIGWPLFSQWYLREMIKYHLIFSCFMSWFYTFCNYLLFILASGSYSIF